MTPLNEIFIVTYGNKLDLNKLTPAGEQDEGVNFVGRSSQNHGVSARVRRLDDLMPYEAGLITVALGGSKLLSSFVQEYQFYTAQNVAVLRERQPMTFAQKLYYCLCIRNNRFRYSAFGREANRTLRTLLVPALNECPDWVGNQIPADKELIAPPLKPSNIQLNTASWKYFMLEDLFNIERGRGPRKKNLGDNGATPFVTSTDSNNGVVGYTSHPPEHDGNTIGVNRNGSVAEAFYQPVPFCSTEDVHVFVPRFPCDQYIALFLTTIIRREKYRFGYGRKWGLERMNRTSIKLPCRADGSPDWNFMGDYIKSLRYSSQI